MSSLLRRNSVFTYDPFSQMDRMVNELFSYNDKGLKGRTSRAFGDVSSVKSADIDNNRILKIALPGVKSNDLELDIQDNYLIWRIEMGEKSENSSFVSRTSGNYYLGNSLDIENVSADLSDGILTVSIPHREQPEPQKIEITTGGNKGISGDMKDSKEELATGSSEEKEHKT